MQIKYEFNAIIAVHPVTSTRYAYAFILIHIHYTLENILVVLKRKACSVLFFFASVGNKSPPICINTTWAVPLCLPTHSQVWSQRINKICTKKTGSLDVLLLQLEPSVFIC